VRPAPSRTRDRLDRHDSIKVEVISMAGRITRRTLIAGGLAVAGSAVEAWGRLRPVVYAQGAALIRFGFLVPLTGTVAQSGRDMLDALQLYLSEHNGTVGGRPVQLIVEDTGGVPANALTKARKLVEEDRVHVLAGPLLASEGYAIRDYVTEKTVPTLYPVVSADDITQRKRSPNIIRTGWSSSQPSHPFGEWVASTLGYKRIAAIGSDYAFGYEVVGGFQRTFEDGGGQIVQKIWVPLGTPDYSPYVTRLRRDVDAVFAIPVGADVIRFVKAYREYGLKDKIPLIGGGLLSDESLLRGMAPEDPVGAVTALMWSAALLTPAARKFVAAFTGRYHKDPSYYAETCYTCAQWIDVAAQHVSGKVEDVEAFLRALRSVQLPDAPRGPIRLDSDQNPIQNIYLRKVELKDGRPQNSVIHTFHNVSQYWTFPRDAFLQQPVYDRAYPPCRYCG
jgi:branched-chain amino acid transport system substrate-binding protein